MKILNLTRETAELQFDNDELQILKNSLLKVYHQFTLDTFSALISGISKDETLQLANIIQDILDCFIKNCSLTTYNQSIDVIKLTKNEIVLRLNYKTILGFRSVLNVVYHGVFISIQNFKSEIGFAKNKISILLDSFHYDVVAKMEEGSLEKLIFNKAKEISTFLNRNSHNLGSNFLNSPKKRACELKFESRKVLLLLTSLKNTKMFSGIQVFVSKLSEPMVFLAKSEAQAIRYNDLVRLVAYLDICLASEINDADLEKFTFSLFNSKGNPIFNIQVVSRFGKQNDIDYLNINFCLYTDSDDININNLNFEDNSNIDNIYGFGSSIQAFLS